MCWMCRVWRHLRPLHYRQAQHLHATSKHTRPWRSVERRYSVCWLYCYKSTNTDAAAAGPSNVSARPRHLLDFTLRPPGVVGLPPDVSPACSRRAAERPDAGAAGAAGHGTSAPTSEWKGGDAGRRDGDTGSAGATRTASGAGGSNKGSASVDVLSAAVDVHRFRDALLLRFVSQNTMHVYGRARRLANSSALPRSRGAAARAPRSFVAGRMSLHQPRAQAARGQSYKSWQATRNACI